MKKTTKIVLFLIGVLSIIFYINQFRKNTFKIQSSKEKYINNIDAKSMFIDKFRKDIYDSLSMDYIHNYKQPEMLIYSLLVSNKWDYGQASYNVFEIISKLDSMNRFKDVPNLDFLNKETVNMAIIYLKKASINGPINAKYILGKYYLEGKYVEKNEVLGNKLLKEAEELSNGVLK